MKVFISYRREDTDAAAQHLAHYLRSALGSESVFIDTDIPAGDDYLDHLSARLTEATKVLVLMGRGWLNIQDSEGQRRLDNPKDILRFEVESALNAGKIVPVLVGDATMPGAQELPESMRALAHSNAIPLRFDHDLEHHLERIARVVAGGAGETGSIDEVAPPPSKGKLVRLLVIVNVVAAACLFGVLIYQDRARDVATLTACEDSWARLYAPVETGATTLRTANTGRAVHRLAGHLDAAAALLREQSRVHCAAGSPGIPATWRTRASRIELAMPAIRSVSVAKGKGPDVSRLTGLVEVVSDSANPKADLEPLVLTPIIKRGGAAPASKPMPALKLSALWRCGSPIDQMTICRQPPENGEERALAVTLSRTAHLYVMIYDDAGHLRVVHPSRPGQEAQAPGDLAIPASGWLKTGQETVLALASVRTVRALESLVGVPQAPENGGFSKAARQALASVALSTINPAAKGHVVQARVRP